MKHTKENRDKRSEESLRAVLRRYDFCDGFSDDRLNKMKSLKDVLASVDLRPDEIAIMNKWRAKDRDLEQ